MTNLSNATSGTSNNYLQYVRVLMGNQSTRMLGLGSIPALTILTLGAREAGEGLNSRVPDSYGGVKFWVSQRRPLRTLGFGSCRRREEKVTLDGGLRW